MKRSVKHDSAWAGSMVALELIESSPGAEPRQMQRKFYEIILFAIEAAEQRRDEVARRLLRRRLRPGRN